MKFNFIKMPILALMVLGMMSVLATAIMTAESYKVENGGQIWSAKLSAQP
jgi:hypothetical protein